MDHKKKYNAAMDLFIESVIKPDHELRGDAISNECLDELLHIREDVLEYLYTIRRRAWVRFNKIDLNN